jgi:hypothetical protein
MPASGLTRRLLPSALNRRLPLRLLPLLALTTAAGCIDLDDVSTVKDLRVLSVRAETPGFLVDLDAPGAAAPADLQSTLTALVVDPKGGGAALTFTAAGCPDILDAISGASVQGATLCATPGTDTGLPDVLRSVAITPLVDPTNPTVVGGIEYQPQTSPFGLTPEQIGLFFTPPPDGTDPNLVTAVQNNRDFGIAALVNMTFTLGSEQATVLKRLVYWPKLDPAQVPNQNPVVDHLEFYAHRDEITGQPIDRLPELPTISIGAGDKLFVLPAPPSGQTWMDQEEIYLLRVRNPQTKTVETRTAQELLTFDFYTTAGTMGPSERRNEVPPFANPGAMIHIDSELSPPAIDKLPAGGVTDIWVVVHDERAGESWAHGTVILTP